MRVSRTLATLPIAVLATLQLWVAQVAPITANALNPGPSTPNSDEELTLSCLGMDSLTTTDLDSTIEVLFPPPGARLAGRGSFVRVFFAHSADVNPGSSLVVSINGQALTTVGLTASTGAGSAFEVPVPAANLHADSGNFLQTHFKLDGKGAAGTFARLDRESLIHYQLVGEDDQAESLAAYPYSVLTRRNGLEPTIYVAVPDSPSSAELSGAWRMLADLGRRAGVRRLTPVVTTGRTGPVPALSDPLLIVGRADRLPYGTSVLQALGYVISSSAITLPGPPRDNGSLAGMPYPFLDGIGTRPTVVALPDTSPATLTGAASAMVALGSRSVASVPKITTEVAGTKLTPDQADSNLIVVGAQPRAGWLDPLGSSLKLTVTSSGSVVGIRPGELVGTLEVLPLPGSDVHTAIWISGTSPSAVAAAGQGLYQRDLSLA